LAFFVGQRKCGKKLKFRRNNAFPINSLRADQDAALTARQRNFAASKDAPRKSDGEPQDTLRYRHKYGSQPISVHEDIAALVLMAQRLD
jgi:hypothetical protein